MNKKNLIQSLLCGVTLMLLATGCAELTADQMSIQFKVVDANTKAPLAGVQSHRYEIARAASQRVNEINPESLPPTDASGMTSGKGTPGGYGFRFQRAGYFDARAILRTAETMQVVTYEVEGIVVTDSPTKIKSHNQNSNPKDVVTIELYPKK